MPSKNRHSDRSRAQKNSASHIRLLGLAAGLSVCLASVWWFWPSKVTLDDGGYDVAIALYRVCNQRDADGIDQVETHLASLKQDHPASVTSLEVFEPVLQHARSSRWDQATRLCHEILTQQVRGH